MSSAAYRAQRMATSALIVALKRKGYSQQAALAIALRSVEALKSANTHKE
jgi:hypothetical protein